MLQKREDRQPLGLPKVKSWVRNRFRSSEAFGRSR